MLELFTDYTLRTVSMGAALLGLVSGCLGTFAVLRQQSLLGDAISHAALPGIAIAFLLTGSKIPIVLMIGALIAGWMATVFVSLVSQSSRVAYDSALGTALSVFFGFGLVLLTIIQRTPNANQAGLNTFLFGQAAAMVTEEVVTMAWLGGIALFVLMIFWKEFKILSFDPEFARSLGYPVRGLDLLLTSLMVVAIVIGLQAVGVVLMSAMLIAPAVGARQWTDRLGLMVFIAAGFGASSGLAGALISSSVSRLPTGPTIVLCVSIIVLFSLLFAPNRGMLWSWIRNKRNARRLREEVVLLDLFALSSQHVRKDHPHQESVLNVMNAMSAQTRSTLKQMAQKGLVEPVGTENWSLTSKGTALAAKILEEQAMR